ncbi:thioredoxin family protein [Cytophaga sp. FL35]|uniref:thioredoxin family protein n=1 Tax=Cytophaga sp. FL35 TaxID=1904456 RepID=UPI0016539D68|nr:thioredoxin family protein [Cytophaga sp. FL35]MBC6997637.1 thioredoxin family protein [Cytophaga sp. FL35]
MTLSTTKEKTVRELIENALSQAIYYEDYRTMVNQLALEGKASGPNQTEALANYTMLNDRRMKRFDKTVKVSEEQIETIKKLDRETIFLVLTESWCGDASPSLPVMNKIAQNTDKLNFKVVLRDEHVDLMNRFLTNGAMSIPKLIILDKETKEVLGDWGPRPQPAAQMVLHHKEQYGKIMPELKEELQQWYNKDKGQTILNELLTSLSLK